MTIAGLPLRTSSGFLTPTPAFFKASKNSLSVLKTLASEKSRPFTPLIFLAPNIFCNPFKFSPPKTLGIPLNTLSMFPEAAVLGLLKAIL